MDMKCTTQTKLLPSSACCSHRSALCCGHPQPGCARLQMRLSPHALRGLGGQQRLRGLFPGAAQSECTAHTARDNISMEHETDSSVYCRRVPLQSRASCSQQYLEQDLALHFAPPAANSSVGDDPFLRSIRLAQTQSPQHYNNMHSPTLAI